MDAAEFVRVIEPALKKRLEKYELTILRDNLPTSVAFLVTSEEFQDVSRWKRIQFMCDVVRETFGLPLEIGASGVALTPKEADELRPWEDDDTSDFFPAGHSKEPAASKPHLD